MRWSGQSVAEQDDGALMPAASVPGRVRTTTTPEFPGMTFYEVLAKSVLSQVPASSAMPFRWTVNPYRGCSHACSYCVSPETPVLMADGTQRPIRELQVGDRIVGTQKGTSYRHYVTTEVLARWSTAKRAHRITLADGTVLTASGDHRFLTGRGWKHVTGTTSGNERRPHLTLNDELLGVGRLPVSAPPDADYVQGHLTGMVRGSRRCWSGTGWRCRREVSSARAAGRGGACRRSPHRRPPLLCRRWPGPSSESALTQHVASSA